eukprot:365660-Chlamydomonas_euryale.AAC.18
MAPTFIVFTIATAGGLLESLHSVADSVAFAPLFPSRSLAEKTPYQAMGGVATVPRRGSRTGRAFGDARSTGRATQALDCRQGDHDCLATCPG